MNNTRTLRLIFLGIGLMAVFALTGMNVYSLYELRESTIETATDNKKNQIEEFTSQVRYRFFQPFRGIRKLDIEHLQYYFEQYEDFPDNLKNVLNETSRDSIFSEIYFSPHDSDHCVDPSQPIYKYNSESEEFDRQDTVSDLVCGGLGLARSRMKILINDYRWNNKVTFDTHRSMSLSMINLSEREVSGHFIFTINRDFLINDYLARNLTEKFGPGSETGLVIWVRDYMHDQILATSDNDYTYERDLIDFHQRFPSMLDNWIIHAKIIESPTIAASNASFTRNLIVLVTAVLALFGALAVMYITAKRERELAQRQASFLANVTHEFKTPLATMQAAGENLSDGRVTGNGSIRTYGKHIFNETIRLRKMIERLLDIARLDSGLSTVQISPQPSAEFLKKYYQEHFDYVTSRGFTFDLNLEPDLPPVLADPDHLKTILDNLIDNSIKYSFDRKKITLSGYHAGTALAISVRDEGAGIPRKSQKRIFEKFYRLEDSMTAKTRGHGLGLSIVKNLVTLNNGSIVLDSSPGQGTSFTITFQMPQTDHQTDPAPLFDQMKKTDYVPE